MVMAAPLLVWGALALPAPQATKGARQAQAWTTVETADGRFSAEMPGTPKAEERPLASGKGRIVVRTLVVPGAGAYLVQQIEDPAPIARGTEGAYLDGFVDRSVASFFNSGRKPSPTARKAITLGDHPGRDFSYEGPAPNGANGRVRGRTVVVLVGQTVYVAQYVTAPGRPIPAEAGRFFDSFRPRAAADAVAAGDGMWKRVDTRDGTFSLAMPGEPRVREDTLDAPEGRVRHLTYTAAGADGTTYVLQQFVGPSPIPKAEQDDALEGQLREFVASNRANTLVRYRAIKLGEHPGREYTIEGPHPAGKGKAKATTRTRSFLVRDTLLVLTAVSPPDQPLPSEAGKFFIGLHEKGRRRESFVPRTKSSQRRGR